MDELTIRLLVIIIVGAAAVLTGLFVGTPKHILIIEITGLGFICILLFMIVRGISVDMPFLQK